MTTARHDRVADAPCERCGKPTTSALKFYGRRWARARVEHRVHVASGLTICEDQRRHPDPTPGQLALTHTGDTQP